MRYGYGRIRPTRHNKRTTEHWSKYPWNDSRTPVNLLLKRLCARFMYKVSAVLILNFRVVVILLIIIMTLCPQLNDCCKPPAMKSTGRERCRGKQRRDAQSMARPSNYTAQLFQTMTVDCVLSSGTLEHRARMLLPYMAHTIT